MHFFKEHGGFEDIVKFLFQNKICFLIVKILENNISCVHFSQSTLEFQHKKNIFYSKNSAFRIKSHTTEKTKLFFFTYFGKKRLSNDEQVSSNTAIHSITTHGSKNNFRTKNHNPKAGKIFGFLLVPYLDRPHDPICIYLVDINCPQIKTLKHFFLELTHTKTRVG